MEEQLIEMAIRSTLEDIVHNRYETIEDIKEDLERRFDTFNLELYEKDMTDIDINIDYNLVGCISNYRILCDFDIYYAKTRANELYITEVGYTFEGVDY